MIKRSRKTWVLELGDSLFESGRGDSLTSPFHALPLSRRRCTDVTDRAYSSHKAHEGRSKFGVNVIALGHFFLHDGRMAVQAYAFYRAAQ